MHNHHIVIVGGGSAGWLTAGLLAARITAQRSQGIKITVIESPDVATIGVGEGTWPSMRHTLQQIGIPETQFMLHCNASFKQGSSFYGWRSGEKNDYYVHPFTTPPGYAELDIASGWRALHPDRAYSDTVSAQSQVCAYGKAPKQLQTPDYAGVTNYGYHFNADKFVELVKNHCIDQLGVNCLVDHVESVTAHPNNDIDAVTCKTHGMVQGDLFVDCTGMRSLLIGQHFNVPWISQRHVLFNDSAVAVQAPYDSAQTDIVSTTLATAQSEGWIWDIGLSNRRGVGYVFASQYTDAATAEQSLTEYLARSMSKDAMSALTPRVLHFKPGYRQEFWKGNCVAIGMSSGFIEPLEASALAMVELSATMLCDHLPSLMTQMPTVRKRFNQRFRYRWQRVIDFIKLHYAISERTDSEYWRDNRSQNSIPDSLHELLELWRHQSPSRYDFIENEEVFPSASYQYVLYGMDYHTQSTSLSTAELEHCQQLFAKNTEYVSRLLQGLPSNRDWLTAKSQSGLAQTG
ncbi:tryptophan halogenase family protein [Aliiglaciecola sp. M165]|uniref:tryptophan halogenase family protein n=1 Tax=Aliiglaciecola sp. M165 TaxID=2593649 RepID=UPI00118091B4|nr:tryptophan halogenase family protein [Aliiglaciecola sp. M165]TRY31754.1 tryptophan 7-halogenase [Aliiglaciecola sp. M165]